MDYDFTQGEDYQLEVELIDQEGEPLNLVGFSYICQIRDPLGVPRATAQLISSDSLTGVVIFKFAAAETIRLAGVHSLQILVIGSTGNQVYAANNPVLIHRNGDVPYQVATGQVTGRLPTIEGTLSTQ